MNAKSFNRIFWQRRLQVIVPAILAAVAAPSWAIAANVATNSVKEVEAEGYDFKVLNVPGASSSSASGINAKGEVIGQYSNEIAGGAFSGGAYVYSHGNFIPFSVPGFEHTSPASINASGAVVGYCSNPTLADEPLDRHGFVYRAGTFIVLDGPGAQSTDATSINRGGDVAGDYLDIPEGPGSPSHLHGFLYSQGTFTVLDVPGAQATSAAAVNDRGEVLGHSDYGAFIYRAGTFTILDALDDIPGSIYRGFASVLNSHGQIAGHYDTYCGGIPPPPRIPPCIETHGFIYDLKTGKIRAFDFPNRPGLLFVTSINEGGQIIGSFRGFDSGDTGGRCFLYRNGEMALLNFPGSYETRCEGINDLGQITGMFDSASEKGLRGFIATPVVAVLDDFNREDGRLGPDWKGKAGVSAYRIVDQQISVGTGGPVYWQPNPFGLDQEAFVTLTRIDPQGAEQGLLLKVQGDAGNYRKGAIAVKYDAAREVIRVATWRPRKASWRNYRDLPVAFAEGDKLGARVLADGKVRIFRNDQQVGRITLGPVDRQFFNERTGRVGLWFENAPNAIVDDFGGGTRMPEGE